MLISKIVILLFLRLLKASGQELLLLSLVHRHGERMPVAFYPNDPHKHDYWPRAEGQLTNEGKRQEHMLGKFIREKYGNLIGNRYFANTTYYRSTDVDRTLMSAELVSAGLFKPHGDDVWDDELPWQPIPIHTVMSENDHLLSMQSNCPEYFRRFQEAEKVPPLSTIIKKYANMFDYLSKYTGMKVTINNFWEIYDDVSKELARNMTEPDWVMKVWDRVVALNDREFGLIVPSRKMQRLKGGPFLKQLIETCKLKAAGNLTYNVLMYSAHDTTLAILLDSLNIYNGLQPPYASAIFMEFYHVGKSKLNYEDFAIKFLYRNSSKMDPFLLLIPGCETATCPFDTFLSIVEDLIPENIDEECNPPPPPPKSLNLEYLGVMIAGFLLVEVVGGIVIYYVLKHQHKSARVFRPLQNEID